MEQKPKAIQKLEWKKMSDDERALATFVQGILNRKGRRVFIDVDGYAQYVDEPMEKVGLWDLLRDNIGAFSGAVAYRLDCNDVAINMAATISAASDLLGVPDTLIGRVNALGLATLRDLSDVVGDNAARQREIFNECKDRLNRTALVHQVVKPDNFHLMLRDFSIANGWACVYTSESEADRAFRNELLAWLDSNVPIYGWNDDEIAFIKDISTFGDYAVPTDWSSNHSFFGQSLHAVKQRVRREPILHDKHYLAIVVSDGDNVQWLERDFATTSIFGQRQRSKHDYKMSWTFSPSLAALCPDAAERIYSGKKHDYFIGGVSGIGYANCLTYPREHLDKFTELTSQAMRNSDLNVVCLLDNIQNAADNKFVEDRLSSYAKYDNIMGGIWELDPDRYGSGKGRIFRAMGKPFVSVRFSMWHQSGKPECVTREWIDDLAASINAMPVSPHSECGYTVLNVHPWTICMDNLDYLVSKLGNHIELVYADELIELVKNNL